MPIGAFKLNSIARYSAPAASGRTALSITNYNNVIVSTTQSKFGGASAYYDGAAARRLHIASGTNIIGTAFTHECWVYISSFAFERQVITQDNGSSGSQGTQFRITTAGKVEFVYWTSSSRASAVLYTSTGTISTNTWTHLAIVWNGSTLTIYKDGTSIGSTSVASMYQSTAGIGIGGFYTSDASPYAGYIDEVRISNTARYTSNFTAPTSAFTNDANTLLLIHANGTTGSTTFTDDGGTFTARTAATISGSRTNATGTFSNAHTSTGGFTLTINQAPTTIGSGNPGTIEFWLYKPSTNGDPTALGGLASFGGIRVSWYSGNYLYIEGTSYQDYGNSIINTNTWVHVAIQTDGSGTWQTYINGTRKYNSSISTSFSSADLLTTGGPTRQYRIDEIRVSKIARYSGTSITVPSSAFTNDPYTLALFHCNSTSETDDRT